MTRRAALGVLAALALASVPASASEFREVRAGESLATIARETLGESALWPALYRANRDQIRDPTLLYPGQKLAIPTLSPEQREAARRDARVRRLQ